MGKLGEVGRDMRKILLALAILAASALPGRADTPEELIVAALEVQGYHLVQRDRTWLGRIWIVVESDEVRREIVFNPGTGEIMRDYAVLMADLEGDASERKSSRSAAAGVAASVAVETTEREDSTSVVLPPALVLDADGQGN